MRISIDAKAKVKIGNLSRGGKCRTRKSLQADDHDMEIKATLAPFGIQNVQEGDVSLYMGNSYETSDFIVDCMELWWSTNKKRYKKIEELVINLDNGPSQMSGRTQFLKRMVVFSKKINLPIHLVYYPPYHSKYNSIEHFFGGLERFWNGAILNTINEALQWASNVMWRKLNPTVELVDKVYQKGIKLTKKQMKEFEKNIQRSKHLPKWDVWITPNVV